MRHFHVDAASLQFVEHLGDAFSPGFRSSRPNSASMSDKPPLQGIRRGESGHRPKGWKTFLHNHADGIASMDLFVAPTISFRLLYGLLILQHDRRQILWLGVTAHPTAEWISHQFTEAYGWKVAPRYIIHDRDAVCGDVFIRRLRAMTIRDQPTAPRSPWQNGYCERAIGSIRRECLDHVVAFGERHLRHLLRSYATLCVPKTLSDFIE
jgi:Integrase core domain